MSCQKDLKDSWPYIPEHQGAIETSVRNQETNLINNQQNKKDDLKPGAKQDLRNFKDFIKNN